MTEGGTGADLAESLSYDYRHLVTSRVASIGGISFDFNPREWPAAGEPAEWLPESLIGWLDRVGLLNPMACQTQAGTFKSAYLGCSVIVRGSAALGNAVPAVLDPQHVAEIVELTMQLVEPDGRVSDIAIPFRFFRASATSLASVRERILRVQSGEISPAGSQGSAALDWGSAGALLQALDYQSAACASLVGAAEQRGALPGVVPRKTASPLLLGLAELIERAIALGYAARSAEFAAYEPDASSAKRGKSGGQTGGRRSGVTRAAKAAEWKRWADLRIDKALEDSPRASDDEIAGMVADLWLTSAPIGQAAPPEPGSTSMRGYVAERRREKTRG